MVWGAAIAAGASLASSAIGAKNAKDDWRTSRSRAWTQLKSGRDKGEGYLGQGQGALEQAIEMVRGQREAALSEVSRMGHSSRQTVLDREKQRVGELGTSMANRGLGNTTVGANLQRGVAADTDRALADINEGLAGLTAGTIGQFAGMEMGALSDFARFMSGRADFIMGAQSQIADVGLGFQKEQGPSDFSGFAGSIDDLIGYFNKGGSGVGAGSSAWSGNQS